MLPLLFVLDTPGDNNFVQFTKKSQIRDGYVTTEKFSKSIVTALMADLSEPVPFFFRRTSGAKTLVLWRRAGHEFLSDRAKLLESCQNNAQA